MKANKDITTYENEAVKLIEKTPSLAKKYKAAPEAVKAYYRLNAIFSVLSLSMDSKTAETEAERLGLMDRRDHIFHEMKDDEWAYLLDHAGHAAALGLYIAKSHMQGKPNVKYGDWLK